MLGIHTKNQKKCIVGFTEHESQCLTQAIQGKDLSKIAGALNISQRSVYFYLACIRKKIDLLMQMPQGNK